MGVAIRDLDELAPFNAADQPCFKFQFGVPRGIGNARKIQRSSPAHSVYRARNQRISSERRVVAADAP